MKFTSAIVLLVASTPSVVVAQTQRCVDTSFNLEFSAEQCNSTYLEAAFADWFNDATNVPDCPHDASTELGLLLAVKSNTIEELCVAAQNNYAITTFGDHIVPIEGGESFAASYYDGGTIWNEQVETKYPIELDDNGNPISHNILKRTAEQVDGIYEQDAQYGIIGWPGTIDNFESCQMNAAYCCWASDRQAGDNNGNCNTPYDENCVDKDPGDNTNICHMELDNPVIDNGSSGFALFPGDNANGEGSVHCHGLAWANDETDKSAVFKGNNLFYVSMYDHMHQRGYVRNIPGAPMCACAEHMPTVQRADCTQIDVENLEFQFMFSSTGEIVAKLESVDIEFASCKGKDQYGRQDNNDLWSYMNQLFREGKVTKEQFQDLNRKLVGEQPDRCDEATEEFMHNQGYIVGYNEDATKWETVAGKGALEDPGVGKEGFNIIFEDAPKHADDNTGTEEGQIIVRKCADCQVPTHQTIFYKRLTPIPEGFDLLHNLKNVREKQEGNVWPDDFQLYSTYEDAVAGTNPWQCKDGIYRYGNGFPGRCSPTGADVPNQDTRFFWPHNKRHVSFSVEVDQTKTLSRVSNPDNVNGYVLKTLEETYEIGDTKQPGAAYSYADSVVNDTKIIMDGYGWDVWNQKDSFTFHASEMEAGDKFQIIAKIESIQGPGTWSKCGIMIREDNLDPTNPSAKNVMMGVNPGKTVWGQARAQEGANSYSWDHIGASQYFTGNHTGIWLKIKYDAGYIHTHHGIENPDTHEIEWKVHGSPRQMSFTGTCHAGLAISSTQGDGNAECVISGFETITHVCTAQRARRHLQDYRLSI